MTPALIGREHPAGVLRAEIGRATDSHGGLVLVTGEAGIGKTSLVTEAADEARRRGALVLGGSCWDSDSAPGYWPWVQVVRGLRRGAGEDWPAAEKTAGGRLAVLLGEAAGGAGAGGPGPGSRPGAEGPGGSEGPGGAEDRGPRTGAEGPGAGEGPGGAEGDERFALYDAVTTALVTVSQRRPVVVVLDDLHWADPASLRLLEFAAQHAWFERLLLIGTYRDAEVETPGHPLQRLILPLAARAAATVTLTGLTREEVGTLITLTAGVEPAPDLVDEVHRRTGGNPFFVEQTVRIWRSGSPVTTVAPGVREAVRRRLSLLPEPVTGVLETAAVLGREFHRQVLAAAVGAPVPHVDRLLESAVAARLVTVRTGGRFAFAHDLVRETLYDALDQGAKCGRHAAVVRALDLAPALSEKIFPADLARHAYLAGDELESGRRVDLLLAAARDASSRLASEEAVGHYRRATEAAGDDRRRVALIALDLGGELWHNGRTADSRRAFERAVELARELRDPELLARVAITLHQHEQLPGSSLGDPDLLRDAHRALIGGSGEDVSDLTSERIAHDLAVRTTDLARSGDDDDALLFALWARHDSIWGLGTSAERLALTAEMIAVARRTDNLGMELHSVSMRWVTLLELGDPRYLDQLHAFTALAEGAAVRRHELAMEIDRCLVAALHGRFTDAGDLLSQAISSEHEHPPFAYMTAHMRWGLFLLQGRFKEARTVVDGLVEVAHPFPALLAGLTAIERGEYEIARLHRDELAALPEPLPRAFEPLAIRLRAQVAAASGDPVLIESARAELAAYSGQWLVSLYGCDISGPVDLWLGLLDAARGDRDAAVAELTSAFESADRMRARPWAVRARAALLAVLGPGEAPPGLAAVVRREAAELGLTHLPGVPRAQGVPPAVAAPGDGAPVFPGAAPASTGEGGVLAGEGGTPAAGAPAAMPPADGVPRPAAAPSAAAVPPSASVPSVSPPSPPPSPSPPSPPLSPSPPSPPAEERRFRRDGAVWALAFDGRAVHVPDAKGLRDLHTLLSHAGDELSAVTLLDPGGGETVIAARRFGGDPVLDEEAKVRYRRRLEQLDREIDRAAELGDDRRAEEFARERAALLDELRTAAGLGGRTRRLGDEAERARKTVTARIRDSLRKLDRAHPELAAHLRESVTTGAYCSYRPPKPVEWRL
ncbi:ATP-binding protein [Streptomyces sp. NPDC055078]